MRRSGKLGSGGLDYMEIILSMWFYYLIREEVADLIIYVIYENKVGCVTSAYMLTHFYLKQLPQKYLFL